MSPAPLTESTFEDAAWLADRPLSARASSPGVRPDGTRSTIQRRYSGA